MNVAGSVAVGKSTIARVLGQAEGRTLIDRTVALRPDDGAIRFAAALISASDDKSAYARPAAQARDYTPPTTEPRPVVRHCAGHDRHPIPGREELALTASCPACPPP